MPSNMPRDVVFGPEKCLGLGHGSLHHAQGAKHIQAILDFGKTNAITGHQIRALIEGHKLELGLPGTLLFEHDWTRLGKCATDTWMSDTWGYMWKEKLRIDEETPSLLPQREGDLFLMEGLGQPAASCIQLARGPLPMYFLLRHFASDPESLPVSVGHCSNNFAQHRFENTRCNKFSFLNGAVVVIAVSVGNVSSLDPHTAHCSARETFFFRHNQIPSPMLC